MALTFLEMQEKVLRLLDETATNSPTTQALVQDFLNEAHVKRCTEYPWGWMVFPTEQSITLVGGQRTYALHELFHRPMYFRSRETKEYLVELPQREVTVGEMDFYDEGQRRADTFVYWGVWPVRFQPSASTTVTIVSSNALDTAVTATITGVNASGFTVSESVSLNGIGSVASTNSFTEILEITKGTGIVGTLTFSYTTGGETALVLGPTEFGKSYKTIFLIDNPQSGEVIGYRFFRTPRTMVNDNDVSLIPPPHELLLVYDALVRMGGYLTDVNPQTMMLWQQLQAEAQLSLYQAYANEGQTYGSETQKVRIVHDPWGV